MFTDHLSTIMYCVRYVIGLSAVRVIRRDTNVWMKEGNQLVNRKEQYSVPDVSNGSRAREEGPSTHVYQSVDVFDLLPFLGQA